MMTLMFFTFFRRMFKVPTYYSKVREIIQASLSVVAIIDLLLAVVFQQGPYLSRFIRILLIIVFIRALRESIKRIVLVVIDSKEILFLLVAYNVFFAWIGIILFKGTQEEQYFPSLTEASWNLLILLTTANFPDIMLPAYHTHRAY